MYDFLLLKKVKDKKIILIPLPENRLCIFILGVKRIIVRIKLI